MVGQQFTLHLGLIADNDQNEDSHPVGNQPENHGSGQEAQPSSPAVVIEDRHHGGEQDGNGKVANTGAAIGNDQADRKSTRLNSSHVRISYAVFCLKKKKKKKHEVKSMINKCVDKT